MATAKKMQEALQQQQHELQVLTARIAALERKYGKPNSAEKVSSQSVVLKERQTVRVTGGTATSSGREEAARGPGGAEGPSWKLQESVKSGVAEETMSAMEKLAKEIDEPDKLRIEGGSEDADEKNTHGNKSPDEVFDEREDTDERVKTLHTEMCKKSK